MRDYNCWARMYICMRYYLFICLFIESTLNAVKTTFNNVILMMTFPSGLCFNDLNENGHWFANQ